MDSSSPSASQNSSSSDSSDKLTGSSDRANDDSTDDLLLDGSPKEILSDDEEAEAGKTRGPYYHKMRRIGLAQLAIALLCIIISIPLTVELHRSSAGSGMWCSAFFILMAGLNFTAATATRPFRVMVAFACTCVYFGVLMLAVECVELTMLITDADGQPVSKLSIALHFVLCVFAVLEIALTVLALVVCKQEIKSTPKQVVASDSSNVDSSRSVNIIIAHGV